MLETAEDQDLDPDRELDVEVQPSDVEKWREHRESIRWQLEDALKSELRLLEPSARVMRLEEALVDWAQPSAPDFAQTGLTRQAYCQLLNYAREFFTDIHDTDSSGQQNWRASIDSRFYGVDYGMPWAPRHRQRRAHRIAWLLLQDPVEPGVVLRHSCEDRDNPRNHAYRRCCNLAHLTPGTPAENVADARERGRLPGRTVHVTASEREQIIEHADAGLPANQIAQLLGRNSQTIINILRQENVYVKRGRCPKVPRVEPEVESEVTTMPEATNGVSHVHAQTTPQAASLLPPRVSCTPPIKWVGSKRWLVPTLAPVIHARLAITRGRYIEPFMGSGAIALDLGLPGMILGDNCKPLVSTYLSIRKSPEAVAWALQTLVDKGTDKDSYLAVRASEPTSLVFAAARFLYLNKFGYNGLYRENSKGKFNVPHGGDRSTASIPDVDDLKAVANALKGADLRHADFRATIARAEDGDVVYVDSPYYETFSDYTAGGFTEDMHTALSQVLYDASQRGAIVIASNSDHERVRELYAWAHVTALAEWHAVGATGERRGMKPAVLIVSDPTMIPQGT